MKVNPTCSCLNCRIGRTIASYRADNPASPPEIVMAALANEIAYEIGRAILPLLHDKPACGALISSTIDQIGRAIAAGTYGQVQFGVSEVALAPDDAPPPTPPAVH